MLSVTDKKVHGQPCKVFHGSVKYTMLKGVFVHGVAGARYGCIIVPNYTTHMFDVYNLTSSQQHTAEFFCKEELTIDELGEFFSKNKILENCQDFDPDGMIGWAEKDFTEE